MKCDNCAAEMALNNPNASRKDGVVLQALSSTKVYILCTKCAESVGIKEIR